VWIVKYFKHKQAVRYILRSLLIASVIDSNVHKLIKTVLSETKPAGLDDSVELYVLYAK
jgi:hypothetical protein